MSCDIPTNPSNSGKYSGIISTNLKNEFNAAINALLEDCACSVSCSLVFANVYADCPTCNSGMFGPGGTTPFYYPGQRCVTCSGQGKVLSEQTEDISLMVLWNSKDWWTLASKGVNASKVSLETFCHIDFAHKLRSAQYLIPNNCDPCFSERRFKRVGDLEPCGIGAPQFVGAAWEGVSSP